MNHSWTALLFFPAKSEPHCTSGKINQYPATEWHLLTHSRHGWQKDSIRGNANKSLSITLIYFQKAITLIVFSLTSMYIFNLPKINQWLVCLHQVSIFSFYTAMYYYCDGFFYKCGDISWKQLPFSSFFTAVFYQYTAVHYYCDGFFYKCGDISWKQLPFSSFFTAVFYQYTAVYYCYDGSFYKYGGISWKQLPSSSFFTAVFYQYTAVYYCYDGFFYKCGDISWEQLPSSTFFTAVFYKRMDSHR